nr:hypothetical protein [Tanacetum cinerariifolium]
APIIPVTDPLTPLILSEPCGKEPLRWVPEVSLEVRLEIHLETQRQSADHE